MDDQDFSRIIVLLDSSFGSRILIELSDVKARSDLANPTIFDISKM